MDLRLASSVKLKGQRIMSTRHETELCGNTPSGRGMRLFALCSGVLLASLSRPPPGRSSSCCRPLPAAAAA